MPTADGSAGCDVAVNAAPGRRAYELVSAAMSTSAIPSAKAHRATRSGWALTLPLTVLMAGGLMAALRLVF